VPNVRLTVLGGTGAWPSAGQACGGYLVESDGFSLLIDPGYAIVPRLLEHMAPGELGAVIVTHRHPDHCADINPLLRARVMSDEDSAPLPVFAPPGALDAVLALDRPGLLDRSLALREVDPGSTFEIGPFRVVTALLPHSVPNVGVRLAAAGRTMAYTGDTGPSDKIAELAKGADLLLAEASYVHDEMPDMLRASLSTARQAGRDAAAADVGQLLLTHLMPSTDPVRAADEAREGYPGSTQVAERDLVVDLG
jgi:ribonuclease BN (tRNA processing enzyme)